MSQPPSREPKCHTAPVLEPSSVPLLTTGIDDQVIDAAREALRRFGAKPARLIGPWVLDIIDHWMRSAGHPSTGPDEARVEALRQLRDVPPALLPTDPFDGRFRLVMRYDYLMEDLPKVWRRYQQPAARDSALRKVLVSVLGEGWTTRPLPHRATPSAFAYDCLRTTAETLRRARRYVYAIEADTIESQAQSMRRKGDIEGALRYENLARVLRKARPGRPARRAPAPRPK
jgi:hypothetical protein